MPCLLKRIRSSTSHRVRRSGWSLFFEPRSSARLPVAVTQSYTLFQMAIQRSPLLNSPASFSPPMALPTCQRSPGVGEVKEFHGWFSDVAFKRNPLDPISFDNDVLGGQAMAPGAEHF